MTSVVPEALEKLPKSIRSRINMQLATSLESVFNRIRSHQRDLGVAIKNALVGKYIDRMHPNIYIAYWKLLEKIEEINKRALGNILEDIQQT